MAHKIFGRLPSGNRLNRIKNSPNYKNGAFQNLSATPVMAEDASFWQTLKEYFNKPRTRDPQKILPSLKTDLKNFDDRQPVLVWFGHSSYFIRMEGKNILVDPVFSKSASPVSFMVKSYRGSDVYEPDDFPELDLLILTHDHYDHLDYKTLKKLFPKVKRICTGLGVGSHLQYWGFDSDRITEFDWWESVEVFPGMQLTASPARHFSGRGISRGKTLWTSFILKTKNSNFYLGGDSGYDAHFKDIGKKYGPFDLAILESGQYNKSWPHIHMMPEETVQAAIDLQAKVLLPVHWGKFSLALHPWDEPIRRVMKEAEVLNVQVTTPRIGEPVLPQGDFPGSPWWLEVSNEKEESR